MTPFLESNIIYLSPVSLSLIGESGYSNWINNQNSDLYTQHAIFPHSREQLVSFVNSKLKNKNSIWLAIILKENNQHIGNIDISDIDWINRTGTYNILIGESGYHGKRIGYHASHLIINHAFNRLNLNRIQLGVQEDNLRAIKLYKAIGFEVEGIARLSILTNGRYINALRMGLLHSEYKFDLEIL